MIKLKLNGHKLHSITSRYFQTADAVLLAAVDAVANNTAKLMEVGELDLIADQAQPQLQSDRSQIGPVVRDEFISL
jgi:hypothetical protein